MNKGKRYYELNVKEGMSYGDIAAVFNTSRDAVAGHIFRYRKANNLRAQKSPIDFPAKNSETSK